MIWANGEKVAIAAGSAASGVLYELLDPLGSTAVVTGSGGQVEGTNVLLPYGQLEQSAASVDPYVYTGKERDAENGSDHAWFRNYASAQMRWLRPDPYDGSYDITNPQSLNRYAYVENNPLAFTDPTGLYVVAGCSQCWGGGGGDGEFGLLQFVFNSSGGLPIYGDDMQIVGSGPPSFANFGLLAMIGQIQSPTSAPNNGRNCTVGPASAGQYAAASAEVAAMTAGFSLDSGLITIPLAQIQRPRK